MATKATTLKVKKRCHYCLHVLREDGTCQYPNCPRYVPDSESEATTPKKTEDK